jgi:hypothetical protein
VQNADQALRQHSDFELAFSAQKMPQLRRKNLGSLSGGRAFNGAALHAGLLADRV